MPADPPVDPTPVDLTLDEMRPRLAAAMPAHVPFDGWSTRALTNAAHDAGLPPAAARLAFPGGATDMIAAVLELADRKLEQTLATDDFCGLAVREKIATAIRTRLQQATPHREALRRAVAVMARPRHAAFAARRAWQTADGIWRLAGDTATDFNHYSKRMTLAAIYSATLLVWLDDDSDGQAATWAFLDRRIAGVMRFEQAKSRLRKRVDPDHLPSLSRFLGRLRYPVDS